MYRRQNMKKKKKKKFEKLEKPTKKRIHLLQ